jgi:Ca2+-transporting ATPase
MQRPPRAADESLFGRREILFATLQGSMILAGVFGLYVWALHTGMEATAARALAFVSLIASNFVLAFADSAEPGTRFFDRRRKSFWMIGAAAAAVVGAVLYQPGVAEVFQLSVPRPAALLSALAIALLGAGWFGLLRRAGILRVNA